MPTVSIRVSPEDLAEIDRRAAGRSMTRTALLIDSALGRTPNKTALEEFQEQTEAQLADHEERLVRLEENAWLQ